MLALGIKVDLARAGIVSKNLLANEGTTLKNLTRCGTSAFRVPWEPLIRLHQLVQKLEGATCDAVWMLHLAHLFGLQAPDHLLD